MPLLTVRAVFMAEVEKEAISLWLWLMHAFVIQNSFRLGIFSRENFENVSCFSVRLFTTRLWFYGFPWLLFKIHILERFLGQIEHSSVNSYSDS